MKPSPKSAKKLSVKVTALKELNAEALRRVQGGTAVLCNQISLKNCSNTTKRD